MESRGGICGSANDLGRSRGIHGRVRRLSDLRNIKDIVQRRRLFLLQSLAEDTAARSAGDVLGDVETHAIQAIRVRELEEEELEEIKGE